MPKDWKDLTLTLGRLFEALTPESIIIWDRPDARRPSVPYMTLNYLTGPVRIAQLDEERVQDDGTIIMCATRNFTLSIKAYIGDVRAKSHPDFWRPIQSLSDLSGKLTTVAIRELFRKEGLAIMNIEGIQDITELLETGYEPRANMDILFSYSEQITDTHIGPNIDKVVITQENIEDVTGITDETFTIDNT